MKAEITNTSKANQGVYTDEGLQFNEPGQTRTHVIRRDYVERVMSLPFLSIKGDESAKTEKPTKGKKAKTEKPAEDARTDDELRAAVVERFGEEGAADLDRQTMIDLLADEA